MMATGGLDSVVIDRERLGCPANWVWDVLGFGCTLGLIENP